MLAVLWLNRMASKRRLSKRTPISKLVFSDPEDQKPSEPLCCRTCLSTADLEPIFANKDCEKKRSRELNLVTGLKIKMDDGLSQKICMKCVEILKSALQFRRKSKKAEKALLESVPKKGIKQKHRLRKKPIEFTAKPHIEDDNSIPYNMLVEIGYEENDFHEDTYVEVQGVPYQDDMVEPEVRTGDSDELDMQEQKPTVGRRRRNSVPNASSYQCPTCGKVFRLKATYKAHTRFHTNFCICETCGKRCRNNHQLQEHKRARHGLGRIHKCAYCEYSSATKEALTIHERRHTGERPYVCDHCGATFHRRSNLVQHIAIHLPEKNFQCDLCPKRLKSKKFLQIHKHNAHTGKRYGYLCPVCAHRFEKPNKVRAHVRRVHGVPDARHEPFVRVEL